MLAGILFKLKFILPSNILKKIYNAHVTSILSYNTPIWCCNYRANIYPIFLLQKRIIRSITKSDYLAHSKPLFKKCKALNIFDLNKLYMSKLFFKNPAKYQEPRRVNHPHQTRNQLLLRPQRCATTLARNSFLSRGPLVYNEVPDTIKRSNTINSFKLKLKKHLLSAY